MTTDFSEKTKEFIKQMDEIMVAIAAERDKLDELINEMSEIKCDCDEAYYDLVQVRDNLSKFV